MRRHIIFLALLIAAQGLSFGREKKSNKPKPDKEVIIKSDKRQAHALITPYANFTEWMTDEAAKTPWEPSHSTIRLFLNDLWKSHAARSRDKDLKEFYRAMFDVSTWKTISVPESQNPSNGEGRPAVKYYRRTADIPSSWSEKSAILHFGALSGKVTVWINGKKAGSVQKRNDIGEAELDISRHIRPGNENLIALELHEKRGAGPLFGIYGDVYVEARRQTYVEDIDVETYFNEDLSVATLVADVKVTNKGKKPTMLSPVVTLYDPDGKEVEHKIASSSELKKGKDEWVRVRLLALNPRLWTDETPYLYSLGVSLDEEVYIQRCGIRLTENRGGTVHVNKQPITIHGIDMTAGVAVPVEGQSLIGQMEEDILHAKSLGLNAVCVNGKTCDPRLYSLCDHYGLYVLDGKKGGEPAYDLTALRDREKQAQIKKECQKVTFRLDDARHLVVTNHHTFASLKNYRLFFTVTHRKEGKASGGDVLMQGHQDLSDIRPGKSTVLAFPLPPTEAEGQTLLNVVLRQKTDTQWMRAGQDVMTDTIPL